MYDYVTENQYADIVNKRLEDDFLVGDCKGTGYVDTGCYLVFPLRVDLQETTASLNF